jgi:hypothetical protein
MNGSHPSLLVLEPLPNQIILSFRLLVFWPDGEDTGSEVEGAKAYKQVEQAIGFAFVIR